MAKTVVVVVGIVAVVLGIIAIIIGISFQDVHYYQLGFKRRKSTGSVDTSSVYTAGRYMVGPDYTFKTFPANAHSVSLHRVAVFTSDRLEVRLSVEFQYFLLADSLKLLHDEYDIYYENIMITSAQDALKNAATVFSTNQFITDRRRVEDAMFLAVRERLGGKCCPKDCNSRANGCPSGCITYSSCQSTDKGLYAEVRYFQMHGIGITSGVADQKLRALTQREDAITEVHKQNSTIVRKQTQQEVQQIQNQITEKTQNASAQAALLEALAHANATALVEGASAEGLRKLYTTLGLTDNQHRAAFDYLRSLRNMEGARYAVDFSQMTMLLGADSFTAAAASGN